MADERGTSGAFNYILEIHSGEISAETKAQALEVWKVINQ